MHIIQADNTPSHNKNSTLCPLVSKDTASIDSNMDADFNPPDSPPPKKEEEDDDPNGPSKFD